MNNDTNRDNSQQTDVSKAQSAQQPAQAQQKLDEKSQDPSAFGEKDQADTESQSGFGTEGETGTMTQQRTDVEGASLDEQETAQGNDGFVGRDAEDKGSDELIDRE